MRMTQNKNDSINSILQHGHNVDKNCCAVFPTSGLPDNENRRWLPLT